MSSLARSKGAPSAGRQRADVLGAGGWVCSEALKQQPHLRGRGMAIPMACRGACVPAVTLSLRRQAGAGARARARASAVCVHSDARRGRAMGPSAGGKGGGSRGSGGLVGLTSLPARGSVACASSAASSQPPPPPSEPPKGQQQQQKAFQSWLLLLTEKPAQFYALMIGALVACAAAMKYAVARVAAKSVESTSATLRERAVYFMEGSISSPDVWVSLCTLRAPARSWIGVL